MSYTYQEIVKRLSPHVTHVLVDKVMLVEHREYAYALKNVSLSDIGFQHQVLTLASAPVFLMIESLTQLALLLMDVSGYEGTIVSYECGRMDATLLPGDTLGLEIKVEQSSHDQLILQGRVLREGHVLYAPLLTVKLADAKE